MAKSSPPYPAEFRLEAVRLLRTGGRSTVQLAAELGCSEDTLRRWAKQADLDDGLRDDGLTTEERAELRRRDGTPGRLTARRGGVNANPRLGRD